MRTRSESKLERRGVVVATRHPATLDAGGGSRAASGATAPERAVAVQTKITPHAALAIADLRTAVRVLADAASSLPLHV
jgi:hypothetical protein